MATSRIDYSDAMIRAEEIQNLSVELEGKITVLNELLATVKREWKGPASEAYQAQLLMLIADMKTTRHDMSGLATAIRNTAERIRKEDEENADNN